ncbi:MAG: ACT domain-containing protein [Candidatus Micrarchaeia archaeon]
MTGKKKKAYVWRQTFAVMSAKRIVPDAFAVVRDKNEITVVIEQSKLKKLKPEDVLNVERNWKIITFDGVMDFNVVGFLARIAKALAEEGISIFAISSYSTDHVLVKAKNVSNALQKLEKIGFETRVK